MKKLYFISLGTLAVLLIFGFIWISHPINLIVENNSSFGLEEVVVTVGPHILEFNKIESGDKKEKWFFYDGSDSSFKMTAKDHTFNDGMGYVTHGPLGFEFVFIGINNNSEINFEQR
tara:strand:+ start:956 stop:1306 length:351 start_codon:yes stop_codon:yes gene_type:complete